MQDITIFQPSYEVLDLPSRGISGGAAKLEVRPITMREEKLFTNKSLAKANKIQNAIFKACVGKAFDANDNVIEGFNVDDLLVEDQYALLIFLRIISYGDDYDVDITCPDCGKKEKYSINLEKDIDVTFATEETPKEIVVELPMSKAKVVMNYPTANLVSVGGSVIDNIPKLIKSASIKGKEVDMNSIDMWCMSLIGRDSSELRNAINTPFGVQKTVSYSCSNPSCDSAGVSQEVDLPITGAFFRISST